MDNCGTLCLNCRMPHSYTSQLQSAQNSEHQQQLQTSMERDSEESSGAALVFTADNSTGKCGLGKGCYRHLASVQNVPTD
jgi:hypothetical protein